MNVEKKILNGISLTNYKFIKPPLVVGGLALEYYGIRKTGHDYDYVVIPITDGKLLLIDKDGEETFSNLKKGVSYFRNSGVEHNVINAGENKLIFVELEIK